MISRWLPQDPRTRRAGIALGIGLLVWVSLAFGFAHARFAHMESSWAYDFGYFNQWYWCQLHGEDELSIRPMGPQGREGPEPWRMNIFQPVRYLLFPVYAAAPGPATLLLLQALAIALGAVFVYLIARSRSSSIAVHGASVVLYLAAPAALGLALNDFRPTQLALPLGLACFYAGVERRSLPWFLICGLLLMTTREECGMVFLFLGGIAAAQTAFGPDRLLGWARWKPAAGWAVSSLVVFAVYMGVVGWARMRMGEAWAGPYPLSYSDGPGLELDVAFFQPLPGFLAQFGALGVLAFACPVLGLPAWLGMLYLQSRNLYHAEAYHHVSLFLVLAVPAAVVGLARIHAWMSRHRLATYALWGVLAAALAFEGVRGTIELARWSGAGTGDSAAVHELRRIAGERPVVAFPEATAILSSRGELYIYGESHLDLEETVGRSDYVILRSEDLERAWEGRAEQLLAGFEVVHESSTLVTYRRRGVDSQ
jgi:uncharacterized membrane protein